MPPHASGLQSIEAFLAQKRIALVGVSRQAKTDSTMLFEELCRRGYDMVPVNPNTPNILGRPCFARVQDIQPPVDAVLIMTTPRVTETVVADCVHAGIRRIWLYRGAGKGSVSPKAIALCQAKGISVIPGECPYMFLPNAAGVHRFHGFVRKVFGHFPRRQEN